MQEKLIHFIWQNLLFNTRALKGVDGEDIQIIQRGMLNSHAGPDFINAKIKIDDTLWAGNVEIHIKSGDWNKHGHTGDKAYDNTILHVCWEFDEPVYRQDGTKIACLILNERVETSILKKYEFLLNSTSEIPCARMLTGIDDLTWSVWQERLLSERLEQKTDTVFLVLKQLKNDWNEVFYRSLARSFGLSVNTEPFETLARLLPLKLIARHRKNPLQIESLIFGVAGFLNAELEDAYPKELLKEFIFLKGKYGLTSMDLSQWKFLRLMPANFPSIRLAQFSALIQRHLTLFTQCLEPNTFGAYRRILVSNPHKYWDTHYVFDHLTPMREKRTGETLLHQIIVNTIVPMQFALGIHKDDQRLKQNAMELLLNAKPENNAIIRQWNELGVFSKNSWQTQALLQLKNDYCSKKRCVECQIGFRLLKNETI